MSTDASVKTLVDKIADGELILPEMQRDYVWKSTNVRDLFDSLYRGYPSGVILVWETDELVETRDFAVETSNQRSSKWLLLDGQQRLTSLAAILSGDGVTVKDRKRDVRLLFNLEHPDELQFDFEDEVDETEEDEETQELLQERLNRNTFMVYSKKMAQLPQWVDVSNIFQKNDREILMEAGVTGFDDPRYEKYTDRLEKVRAIAKYPYHLEVLDRHKTYDEVTEIFVRVNSLGVKLRSSDLALAQITAKWRGALDIFTEYQKSARDSLDFDVDMGIILRALVALVTNQSRFQRVGSLSLDMLKKGWDHTTRAFDFALNYVKSNLGIDTTLLLSSPFLLVATAYWGDNRNFQISEEDSTNFKRWFLIANAKGRYSGSSETKLDQDISIIRNGGGGIELLNKLLTEVGRFDFTANELRGRNTNSGAFKTLFMALRADGVKDWESNLEISTKHKGEADRIENHHIFPKKYLERVRPDLTTSNNKQINQIANMAFIGGLTNRHISDKAPSDYRQNYDSRLLAAQLIDFYDGRDKPENFEQFIDHRLNLMAAKLNEFLGVGE